MAKKYDEAIASFDKALSAPNSVQVIKGHRDKREVAGYAAQGGWEVTRPHSMPADYAELEARIGYTFADRGFLLRALTHKSIHSEAIAGELPVLDNEKLEFLGDSILGFVASEYMFRRCPQSSEGTLSRLKAQRVSSAHLYKVASELRMRAVPEARSRGRARAADEQNEQFWLTR